MNPFDNLSYDPTTGIFEWKETGRGRKKRAGNINNTGYRRISVGRMSYLAHRLAWFITYGYWPKGLLDHVNGDRDDNRIANLRECNRAQNMANSCKRSDNSSGFKGVSRDGDGWRAYINTRYLGHFSSIEEAHAAYCAAAREHFGEFFNPGQEIDA